jgi:hypothetical protein
VAIDFPVDMDHLLDFPNGSQDFYETKLPDPMEHVRFVADREDFDVGDFDELPKGHTSSLIDNGPEAIRRLGLSTNIPGFLQSWLFFSLLSRVLDTRINVGAFRWNDSQYVHTRNLRTLLDNWKLNEKSKEGNIVERTRKRIRIDSSLDEASSFLSKWSHNIDRWDVSPNLWLSFAILGETLTRARLLVLPIGGISGLGNADKRRWGSSECLEKVMTGRGWCRSTVQMVQSTVGNLSGLYVAASLTSPDSEEIHKNCSSFECTAHIVDEKKFPLHSESCKLPASCRMLEPPKDVVIEILRRENIPLMFLGSEKAVDDKGKVFDRECIKVQEYDVRAKTLVLPDVVVGEYGKGYPGQQEGDLLLR